MHRPKYTLSRALSQRSFNFSITFANSSPERRKRLSTNARFISTVGSLSIIFIWNKWLPHIRGNYRLLHHPIIKPYQATRFPRIYFQKDRRGLFQSYRYQPILDCMYNNCAKSSACHMHIRIYLYMPQRSIFSIYHHLLKLHTNTVPKSIGCLIIFG